MVRLYIRYRGKSIKIACIWRIDNMLLKNQQIMEEIKICIKANENENMTTQNLRDSEKAVLRERLTAIKTYLKKQEETHAPQCSSQHCLS